MSMSDRGSGRISHDGTQRLPEAGKHRRALGIFILLQVYFASNVLSFGFWKSVPVFFGYQVVFFGTWLVSLVLLLFLFLRASTRFGLSRFDPVILLIFSLPFCFGLWLQSLDVLPDRLWWNTIWIVPLMFIYFRFGVLHAGTISFVMVGLCILSFVGHSDVLVKSEHFRESKLSETDIISLDRKTSVHMIVFDAFAPSSFTNIYLGSSNPAADYLSTLDDTIYAGSMGFAEYIPTRNFYGSTFELEKNRGNYSAFSGNNRSLLTDLLRKNGYYIQTGFTDGYLGASQGEYVDRYIYDAAHLRVSLVCADRVALLGFCSELSHKLYGNRFRGYFKQKRKQRWIKEVMDLIDQAERSQPGPVFSAFHIYYPGHTSNTYQTDDLKMFEEFKEKYFSRIAHVNEWLKEIDRLRQQYPDSVFIISGDHGPLLSRTEFEDRRFIILDRHNVALALLNAANLCPWSKNWLEQQRYLTPSRMLAASLACDGESRKLTEHFKDNEEFIRFGEFLSE